MVNPGLLLRFILSAALGGGVAVGTAAITAPPLIVSTAHAGSPMTLTGQDGSQLKFALQPDEPKPLAPLTATSTIQLTSFENAPASFSPSANVRPPWWNASVPRVPAITQFDGGPLQDSNCTMASGAMLARLAFGIVTTGSQLRALQDDQDGYSNLGDLQTAVGRGWGVHFFTGALTPLQLRALLYAGAGAEVIGNYFQIPVALRLQKDFTGNHAIYIDAFRPPGPDGPAAYYVMDPLGRTWAGYKGDWWPAEDVERFATVYGGGMISTAWAFAGGVVPADHPILPPSAYPSATPSASEGPGASEEPGASPSASAGPPAVDPMPTGNLPLGNDPGAGTPPPIVPKFPRVDFLTNAFQVEPGLLGCAVQPTPPGCPRGIIGVIDLPGLTTATASAPPIQIKLLYANPIAPGTYQIIFESPPDSRSAFWLWGSAGGGKLEEATVESGVLDGKDVSIATITLDPNADFSFVATATGDGVRAISPVGSLDVTP
jgi:hypothetical protein